MDRRVTPLKRVTSPTWGPPPPFKQALKQRLKTCFLRIGTITGWKMSSDWNDPRLRYAEYQAVLGKDEERKEEGEREQRNPSSPSPFVL